MRGIGGDRGGEKKEERAQRRTWLLAAFNNFI